MPRPPPPLFMAFGYLFESLSWSLLRLHKSLCSGSDTCVMRSANFRWVARPEERAPGSGYLGFIIIFITILPLMLRLIFPFFSSSLLYPFAFPPPFYHSSFREFSLPQLPPLNIIVTTTATPSAPSLVGYRRRGHFNVIISIVALFIIPEFRRTLGFIYSPFPKSPLLGKGQLA